MRKISNAILFVPEALLLGIILAIVVVVAFCKQMVDLIRVCFRKPPGEAQAQSGLKSNKSKGLVRTEQVVSGDEFRRILFQEQPGEVHVKFFLAWDYWEAKFQSGSVRVVFRGDVFTSPMMENLLAGTSYQQIGVRFDGWEDYEFKW